MLRAATFALLLVACGGKSSHPGTTPVAHEQGGHGEHGEGGEGDEHGEMSPEMKQFHDLLHPRWSMAAGPERQKSTCDAIAELEAASDALGKSTPPQTTNADSWTAGTRAVADAMSGLTAACSSGKGFDAAFQKVHDSFHSLMTQGEHGQGGGGSKGEHTNGDDHDGHGDHGGHEHGGGT